MALGSVKSEKLMKEVFKKKNYLILISVVDIDTLIIMIFYRS